MISASLTLLTPRFCPFHTQTFCLQYQYKQGGWKTGLFTAAVLPLLPRQKNQLDQYFCATPLLYVSLYYPKIRFTNIVITTLLYQGKSLTCANAWTLQSPTIRLSSSTLWTPLFVFCCTRTNCIQYQYKLGDWKTGRFTTLVQPTLLWQTNRQMPVILVLMFFLFLIYLQCDSNQCLKLYWLWG